MNIKPMFAGNLEKLRAKLWLLDLEPIILRLMDEDEGEGWPKNQALVAVEEYRRFLFLNATNPSIIVPTKFVDAVWHAHILDTMKYMDDCQELFGFYLHHFPYFGMRGEQDKANLQLAFKATAEIYELVFEQPYLLDTRVADCGTCGGCSGSCTGSVITSQTDIVHSELRPSLAMLSH
jgi:hypothetical protein